MKAALWMALSAYCKLPSFHKRGARLLLTPNNIVGKACSRPCILLCSTGIEPSLVDFLYGHMGRPYPKQLTCKLLAMDAFSSKPLLVRSTPLTTFRTAPLMVLIKAVSTSTPSWSTLSKNMYPSSTCQKTPSWDLEWIFNKRFAINISY